MSAWIHHLLMFGIIVAIVLAALVADSWFGVSTAHTALGF